MVAYAQAPESQESVVQALLSSQSSAVVHALAVAAGATSTASRPSIAARGRATRDDLVPLTCPCLRRASQSFHARAPATLRPPWFKMHAARARHAGRSASGAWSPWPSRAPHPPSGQRASRCADGGGRCGGVGCSRWVAGTPAPHGECSGGRRSIRQGARSRELAGAQEARSCKGAREARRPRGGVEGTLPARRTGERAGLVEPAVERPRPPLVGEDRVL